MALTEEEKKLAEKLYGNNVKVGTANKPAKEILKPQKVDYTPAAQKRKQQTSESIATKVNPSNVLSAKAVSSEAEQKPIDYTPAAQKRRQATSDQIYENVLKGEAYLQSPGEDLAKGLINRLRSAGGETVENVARVINDNVAPDSYFGKTSQNVIDRNVAGNIGDLADTQLARVKEKTGDVGDFLVDVADSGANMASQAILSGVLLPGASVPVANKIFSGVQGVSAGTQKYVDTREEGGSKEEAWQRGIGSGTVAAITEGLTGIGKTGISRLPGVNKVVTKLDVLGTKNWLTNVFANAIGEGGEEGLEYAFEYASDVIADLIYKGEIETDFDVAELFRNALSGAVMGAGFGGVQGSIGRNIPQNGLVLNEANTNVEPVAKPEVPAQVETPAKPEVVTEPTAPAEQTLPQTENVTLEVVNEQEGPFANVEENVKAEEVRNTVKEEIAEPNPNTNNPITEETVEKAAEILEESPEEILEEEVPEQIETDKAKAKIEANLEKNLYAGGKRNLEQIKKGNFTAENISVKGNVPGFNKMQRASIVDQLIAGKNKNIIDIKIPDDGEMQINNTPASIATVLDQLKVEIKAPQNSILSEQVSDFSEKAEKIFEKTKNTVAHFSANGKDYVSDGAFTVFAGKENVNKLKEDKSFTWKDYGEKNELIDKYAKTNGFEIKQKPVTAKANYRGAPKVALFNYKGTYAVFNANYLDAVKGQKLYIGNLSTFSGDSLPFIKSVDANGNVGSIIMPMKVKPDVVENLLQEKGINKESIETFEEKPVSANAEITNAQAEPYGAQDGAHPNTVGGMESNPKSYAHLQNKYDVMDLGENPRARDAGVPKRDVEGNRVSQGARNFMEAKVTPDELIPAFEKEVAAGTFENKGTSNKEAVGKAAGRIANKPFKDAVNEFRTLYSDDKLLSKDDVVFGELLYSMAAQNGEADTAMELASLLVSNSSRTGDALQAQRILKRLSPEGRLYHTQQVIEKLNKDSKQKNKIVLDEDVVSQIMNAKTDAEIDAAADAAAENIAKQIDKGFLRNFGDMWNAWRYLSMLGNPKTHIRNILGNTVFLPVRKVKNVVKAGIESAAQKAGWIDEKTATVKLATKENRDFAKQSFEANKKTLTEGGNYRFETEIEAAKKPFYVGGEQTPVKKFFNGILKPASKAAEFNSKALEAEDLVFLKNAYVDSLTQYLTANNLDAKTMTEAQKTSAENYASQEALKATYRDFSAIARILENLASKEITYKGVKVKPFKFLIEATVPFRKTPINILARGVEYSPVGLATTIALDGRAVKNGDITANEMIDHLASGLTGSGLFALGMFLAKQGLLSGGESDDENEKNFAKLQGEQAYALKIGDGSYTVDWLAPAILPVFIGVETMKVLEKEYGNSADWGEIAWTVLKNLDRIANPMLELSMLQNLDSFLGSNYSKEGNAISGLAMDLLASYVLSLIPTLSSQIAQTIDGTRRNAYYVDKTDKIPDEWQIPLQRAMAKIPGLSQKLPAYVDAWGRTQKQSDNVGIRIAENFLSPGYYKKKTVTEADEMLKQLIKETGDTSLAPKGPSQKYVTVNGTDHPLSAKEYEEMAIEKGQKQYDLVSQLVADKSYGNLDSENKTKTIKGVYEYAGALSKEGVHGYKLPKEWQKVEEAKKDGLAESTYLSLKPAMGATSKDIDKMKYLIADKGTNAKEKVIAMEYLTDINMDKYKKFSSDPQDIINARMIYLEEDAKGNGAEARMVDRMFADKNTSDKEDIAFMEHVLGKNMAKYREATTKDNEIIDLYKVVSDDAKKVDDIKALTKKGYSSAEALAKYNVASGTKKYQDGEFKFGNATKQVAKANKLKKAGYSPATIVKAANAVTSLGDYGTTKNYSTCVKMLKAVGITDEKFIKAFWNVYVNG